MTYLLVSEDTCNFYWLDFFFLIFYWKPHWGIDSGIMVISPKHPGHMGLHLARMSNHQFSRYLTWKRRVNFGVNLLYVVVRLCHFFFRFLHDPSDLLRIVYLLFYNYTCSFSDFDDLESSSPGRMGALNYTRAGR